MPPAPLLAGTALAEAYRRIGKDRPIILLWGVTGSFPLYWRIRPHPVDLIIDSNPALHGRSYDGVPIAGPERLRGLDPARTLIVLLPFAEDFAPDILQAIGAIGPFPVIPAHSPETDGALFGSIDVVRAARHAALAGCIAPKAGTPRKVTLTYGKFMLGGAERQLTLLADSFRKLGWTVELALGSAPSRGTDHYLGKLAREGTGIRYLTSPRELFPFDAPPGNIPPGLEPIGPLLGQVNAVTGSFMAALYLHLVRSRPDFVVAYTDRAAIAAGYAALAAGVPQIQLSQRGTDLDAELRHYGQSIDFIREHYLTLSAQLGVTLTNNSRLGARNYERWIGLSEGRIRTVYNGIDPVAMGRQTRSPAELRAELGIAADAPLLLGVFRLDPEKRPLMFVEVLAAICRQRPAARAILVGEGRMQHEIEAAAVAHGLTGRLFLVGAQADMPAYFRTADLLLHTAEGEGTPNVVIEAGLNALPVVATRAGATLECLPESAHAYCHALDDKDGLAASCLALLADPERRRALGAAASDYVRRTFLLDRLAPDTLAASGLSP